MYENGRRFNSLTDVIALLYVTNSIRTNYFRILTRLKTLLIKHTLYTLCYMMLDKRT